MDIDKMKIVMEDHKVSEFARKEGYNLSSVSIALGGNYPMLPKYREIRDNCVDNWGGKFQVLMTKKEAKRYEN